MRPAEQPQIEVPQWLVDLGWVDHSWRQDSSAMGFIRVSGPLGIWVWVAEEDPKDREDPTWSRFNAYLGPEDDAALNAQFGSPEMAYDGDDEVACRDALLRTVERLKETTRSDVV